MTLHFLLLFADLTSPIPRFQSLIATPFNLTVDTLSPEIALFLAAASKWINLTTRHGDDTRASTSEMTSPLALVASSAARAGPSKAGKRNRGSRRVAARGTAAPSKPKKKIVESSKRTPKRDAPERAAADMAHAITDEDSYPAFLVEYLEMACRPSPEPTSRREALSRAAAACSLGAVSSMMSFPAPPAAAIYNKDLDIPITDPTQAMATVFAARAAVQDVLAQIADFEETCPAPVFPCDLSQLSVKASTRVSGPLKRALPTLSEVRSGYTGSHTTAFAL
jgi:hypothetical protein